MSGASRKLDSGSVVGVEVASGTDSALPRGWQVFVYALTEPTTGVARYVGLATHPRRRMVDHLSEARNAPRRGRVRPKDQWILELATAGAEPRMVILEHLLGRRYLCDGKPSGEAREAETGWIKILEACGAPLFNIKGTPRDLLIPYGMPRGSVVRGAFLAGSEARARRVSRLTPTIKGFLHPVPGLPPATLLDLSEPRPLTAAGLRASWQPAGDPR